MIKKTLLTAAFLVLFLFSGCAKNDTYRTTFLSLGTTIDVTIPLNGVSSATAKYAADESKARVSLIDKTLSIFDKNSAVSIINNDLAKKGCEVDPDLYLLIKRCKEYYTLTGGAFDITVEPLVEAWGFGPARKKAAQPKEVEDILKHVGMNKITFDDKTRTVYFKDPRMRIDFGGVAPGYAADEVAKILKRHGIRSVIINIGGEIYCLGSNSAARKWVVGIRHPDDKNKIIATLNIEDKAISTSGDYENFYIYGGKEYSHIIDPRTGSIARNSLRSVTILADDCTTADALATAVFVLGEDNGMKLINKLPGIEAFLVIKDGKNTRIRMSDGMKGYIARDEK